MSFSRFIIASLAAAVFGAGAAAAEDKPSIRLELNNLEDLSAGCRFTFVSANSAGHDIEKAAFEVAFFNADGLVDKLTTLNFGQLQDGRTVVRQFEIPGSKCDGYSRVLINAVKSCDGFPGGVDACEAALATANKSKIEFGA
ncbi:hypothetical protein [Rhizobium sp. L1K21]|uniref:hypothetical protein n=1 Tax=Rhizobium sp. L1K21 TaxID=2954933 RepID=UPI002093E876|nr:hypothetical protein [Rhizobium sp. L1K21]MCO6185252.1 hypothetical protein [Rhizobium sp. L1K21]